ncbi:winged helix DNA-binding domain-containing protein [Sinomonas humi]|uniref:Winged helix DNA-binding domain-containing protein n=1 Tax=Sinomonas humi TaxID=1338436 RepID=A0A0B2AQP7_9MICC|nr:winged helix DNA-binding domain-containing protein [Sinomonas humi]KHL04183.1 hypothetical protein LK10_06375 [Sinomonas humi]
MRTFSARERRLLMVQRHHLAGDSAGPDQVAADLIGLHATDPASVYLSVLARSAEATIAEVAAAMYDRRTLVRWMAMRRTLFLFPTQDVPIIQAAVSSALALTLHRQLESRIRRNGTDPPLGADIEEWLDGVGSRVRESLGRLGSATGAQLGAEVPELRTTIRPGSRSERAQNLTSPLLTAMSAAGGIVRGSPTGAWTSRHHRWEPVERWWPEGMPELDAAAAQSALARRWLERFGPATMDDLQWWTGWSKTTVRRALTTLPVVDVDLHGQPGIALSAEPGTDSLDQAPVATLLPSLDPTPMGWKHREWFLGISPHDVFDAAGNIGPTAWWDGEIIGSWAVASAGEVRTVLLADRGHEAAQALDAAAAHLQQRLDGTAVTPAIRTRLERSLTQPVR